MTHAVVPAEAWLAARKELLAKEKEFTRLRDQVSALRRELPWEAVTREYVFEGPDGRQTLPQLFAGRSQLIVYHFMFAPDWDAGCPHCSHWADNFNGGIVHLNQRDVTMIAVSRAPYARLAAYHKRMGWKFKWVSSNGSDFNFDYHVSFTEADKARGKAFYNYELRDYMSDEMPGYSVFYKDETGEIFHTYSVFARGSEQVGGVYGFLDVTPKGRNEPPGGNLTAWVRRHDEYGEKAGDSCCQGSPGKV